MTRTPLQRLHARPRRQRGIATLLVAMIILIILSIIVLFSANVGFFEQRTAINENRARLAEQAAEYAINLSGEYLRANRESIIRKTTGGWLAADVASGLRWKPCLGEAATLTDGTTPHPCQSERDAARRAKLYFYTTDGTSSVGATQLPYTTLVAGAALETTGVGGTAQFDTTTAVRALLCRFNTNVIPAVCETDFSPPAGGNRIAVTLIGDSLLDDENGAAAVKETWATFSSTTATSAVPIIAGGTFDGGGNITVVTAPNAGGYGVPGSIWTPADAQVEDTTGGGAFSFTSCYVGDFMRGSTGERDVVDAKLKCPTGGSNPPCHCPTSKDDPTGWLSGHPTGGDRLENIDILDRDNGACDASKGHPCPPDIHFFPGSGVCLPKDVIRVGCTLGSVFALDQAGVQNDDSLFEWIFGVDYVVADQDINGVTLGTGGTTCSKGAGVNCFDYAMRNDLGLDVNTHILTRCDDPAKVLPPLLDASSSGLYYVTGNCIYDGQVGSRNAPVIVVVTGRVEPGPSSVFYGMLFTHRDDVAAAKAPAAAAAMRWNGGTIFGAVVVEGKIELVGNPVIVYDDTTLNNDPNTFPASATFARVAGSWLDSRSGF